MPVNANYIEAMNVALDQARDALNHDDVPVGAVVLHEGKIIAARHNERENLQDPTAHAEILALQDAAKHLGRWRLDDCTLVVTLEPCVMCAGALLNSRIGSLVYGAADLKGGATASLYNVSADPRLNHNFPGDAQCFGHRVGCFARAVLCLTPITSDIGRVPEWPKGHASKACDVQASVGSNPTSSARDISSRVHHRVLVSRSGNCRPLH